MSTSASPARAAAIRQVRVTDQALTIELVDGRVVSVPIAWYPRLAAGSARERRAWVLVGPGSGIHWPGLDEDISVDALLRGLPSGESAASFRRWTDGRRRQTAKLVHPTNRAARPKATARVARAARD